MPVNPDIHEKTYKLIKALNLFVLHVFVYFVANISISLYTFNDIAGRWPLLFVVVIWAAGLIYHGIRVYGIDPVSNKRIPRLLTTFLNAMGV